MEHEFLDVAIDVSAIKPNSGGVRRYAHELIAELGAQQIRPVLLARSNDDAGAWPGADRFVRAAPSHPVRRLVWEQTSLLRTLRRAAPDVGILHSPHYTMPSMKWFGHRRSVKRVVTIHDLSYFTRPQDHSRDKRALFTRAIAAAAKSADALICVSDRTAQTLNEFVTVNAPIFIAPHGIDHSRFFSNQESGHPKNVRTERGRESNAPHPDTIHADTIHADTIHADTIHADTSHADAIHPELRSHGKVGGSRDEEAEGLCAEDLRKHDAEIRRSLGVEGDYLFSLSAIEPRKNIAMLIRAYEQLLADDASLRNLVLVIGGEGWPGVAENLPTSAFGRIVKTGFVPESGVAPLFRGALGVAYPSLEEGFGLPALEALACGAPVVTTRGSVMHELLGEAAIAVDVTTVATLAAGLAQAIAGNGPDLATRLRKAKTFTWTNSAIAHAAAYRSCR